MDNDNVSIREDHIDRHRNNVRRNDMNYNDLDYKEPNTDNSNR